jgi:hypothetical protein
MKITGVKVLAFVAFVGMVSGGTVVAGSVGASSAPVSTNSDPDVLRIVYTVGTNHGASDKVMLAGFEACVVESGCRNLPGGDRDSAGVFQQRPSMNWGTWTQVTDVQYAARQFFTRAIAAEHCCATSGQLAQRVQVSCCPDKYDEHEATARAQMAKGRALHLKWLQTHGGAR